MKNIYNLVKLFFNGDDKVYARVMGFILVCTSLLKVRLAFLFSEWNGRFYNALEKKDWEAFKTEALWFLILAASIVFMISISKYLCQRYALRWRIWMTNHALATWLSHEDRELEGVDQRIQEDLMKFTDLFEEMCLEMLNNIVIIVLFTPFLFKITEGILFFGFNIPGLLFYVVIVYTLISYFVSKMMGKPLVQLEYESQKYEASFRYELVHVRDGREINNNGFKALIEPIIKNHVLLYRRQGIFNFWQKGYDQLSFLIPFVILVPSYFSGAITLGMVMQSKSFVSRIRNAMAYILDNYIKFMEFLAVAKRLSEFYEKFNKTPM